MDIVEKGNFLHSGDGVFFRADLDLDVVVEGQLGQSSGLSVGTAVNGVVVVGIVDVFTGDGVEIGSGGVFVEIGTIGEIQVRGDDVSDGIQSAFLKLVHKVNLGGQCRADVQVVQGIKTTLKLILSICDDGFAHRVCNEGFAIALKIPSFREVDIRVPVDEFGNLDGDGDGNVVLDAQGNVFPGLFLEKQTVGGVDLRGHFGAPFHRDVVIPFQCSRFVFLSERIKLCHRHIQGG